MKSHAIPMLLLALAWSRISPAHELVVVRGDGVSLRYTVEFALDPDARMRGLMGRTALPARHGMWFDFGVPAAVRMWMKDTPLALDMAFVDPAGRIVHVVSDTVPCSHGLIGPSVPVRYVLELAAGTLRADAVGAGAQVVLSGLPVATPQSPRAATSAAKPASKPASDTGTSIGCRSPSRKVMVNSVPAPN
jgi:uncharacterized protein